MNKPILIIDQDEVLADFLGLLLTRYNMFYNKNVKKEDITQWNLKPFIGYQGIEIFHQPGFFRYLSPIEGAIETTQKLQEEGYEIIIATNPETPWAALEKYQWIEEWMPFINKDQVIMTGKKHLICADLIFDDCPHYLINYPGYAICMDRPYNQGVGDYRVSSWDEFYRLVHKILPIRN